MIATTPKKNPGAKSRRSTGHAELSVPMGLRIRAARYEAGLTQTQLATMLGLSFQQIQKYEKGVNTVAPGNLVRISQALKKPVTWFFNVCDEAPQSDLGAELLQTSDGTKMARLWLGMDLQAQQVLLHLALYLASVTGGGDE